MLTSNLQIKNKIHHSSYRTVKHLHIVEPVSNINCYLYDKDSQGIYVYVCVVGKKMIITVYAHCPNIYGKKRT